MKLAPTLMTLAMLLTAVAHADDDVARDSANLKQLLGEIRQALPAGWRAEITPDVPEDVNQNNPRLHGAPCLAVWHVDKVLGKYNAPNLPVAPPNPEAEYEPMLLRMQFTVTNFLTEEQYRKAVQENDDRLRRRLAFEKRLAGIRVSPSVVISGNMRGEAVPAWAYQPETPEQKELVRQYGLLWMRTMPAPLPTHRYRTLSFHGDLSRHIILQNPQIDAQRDQVQKAILRLVTPYAESRPGEQ